MDQPLELAQSGGQSRETTDARGTELVNACLAALAGWYTAKKGTNAHPGRGREKHAFAQAEDRLENTMDAYVQYQKEQQ
jgi:hypothetical protein